MIENVLSGLPILISLIFIVFFAVLYANYRVVLYIVNSLLWTIYAVYEAMIYSGVLCFGGCTNRVDLLAIYSILLVATLGGITVFVHSLQKHKKNEKNK
jgi:uncharacterized membrane protein YqhA